MSTVWPVFPLSRMARDQNTTFGKTVENFIQCTKEASETNPNVVVRNVSESSVTDLCPS